MCSTQTYNSVCNTDVIFIFFLYFCLFVIFHYYVLFYSSSDTLISSYKSASSPSFYLPLGNESNSFIVLLRVKVSDVYGCSTYSSLSVKVRRSATQVNLLHLLYNYRQLAFLTLTFTYEYFHFHFVSFIAQAT